MPGLLTSAITGLDLLTGSSAVVVATALTAIVPIRAAEQDRMRISAGPGRATILPCRREPEYLTQGASYPRKTRHFLLTGPCRVRFATATDLKSPAASRLRAWESIRNGMLHRFATFGHRKVKPE